MIVAATGGKCTLWLSLPKSLLSCYWEANMSTVPEPLVSRAYFFLFIPTSCSSEQATASLRGIPNEVNNTPVFACGYAHGAARDISHLQVRFGCYLIRMFRPPPSAKVGRDWYAWRVRDECLASSGYGGGLCSPQSQMRLCSLRFNGRSSHPCAGLAVVHLRPVVATCLVCASARSPRLLVL